MSSNLRIDSSNPFSLEINTGKGADTKFITFDRPEILPINSIKMELELFIEAILHDKETPVTLLDGCNAMDVAYQILERIEKNNPS